MAPDIAVFCFSSRPTRNDQPLPAYLLLTTAVRISTAAGRGRCTNDVVHILLFSCFFVFCCELFLSCGVVLLLVFAVLSVVCCL